MNSLFIGLFLVVVGIFLLYLTVRGELGRFMWALFGSAGGESEKQ